MIRSIFPVLGLSALLLSATTARSEEIPAVPALAPTPTVVKTRDEWKQFMDSFYKYREKDAASAVKAAEGFLQLNPRSQAFFAGDVVWEIALTRANNLKDLPGALGELDAAIAKAGDDAQWLRLVPRKAKLMRDRGQTAQALAYLQEQWPALQRAMYANPSLQWDFIPAYSQALKAAGQEDEALSWLRQATIANLCWADDQNNNSLIDRYINALWADGRDDEAVSWAKLNWMLCAFDSKALDNATQLLGRAWAAKGADGPTKVAAFIKAQTEAGAPNPLSAVALPQWSAEEKAILSKETSQVVAWSGARPHVAVRIALGDWRKAMLEARRAMLNDPTSPEGLAQMCRVLKASDGNLVRANQLVAYYRDKTGENPVEAFLKEHEATK